MDDRTDAAAAADPVERVTAGRDRSGDRTPGSGPDTTRETLRVVMVDDEEALCLGVRRIVDRYRFHLPEVDVEVGYEFEHFQSGEAFLSALAAGSDYDLLLLDLKLPGINGLDVLTEITEQGREILTLFITAYATFETAVKATKLGAYDFLPKPFSPDELRYGLRKASSQLILSRQARKLAEQARQIRFNFISVLAHELKSPINAVEGYLNILRDDVPEGDRRMVERSLVRLDGMKKLIFDLLDVTRIESGQKQRSFTAVDVAAIAAAAIDLFELDAADKRVTIALDAPDAVPLHADAGEIEIIVNNLVSNAVKYNREAGSVDVRLRRAGETVTLTVADTGIGLEPDEAAKLFNEFTRIKNEDTVTILGSGLGLSTVRKLARMYGGDATVVSTRGEGSTFTVTLHDATDAPPAA
jgi:two-component system, sensor histidine kinase and response regulator